MSEDINPKIDAFNCPNCGAAVQPESVSCPYCKSSIATRICSLCYGSVTVGMRHCPNCGAVMDAPRSDKAATLDCPRCRTELSIVAVGRQEIHECLHCGGLWLNKETFQEICTRQEEQEAVLNFHFEASPPAATRPAVQPRAYVPCPQCGKLMNRENFAGCSGVILDWCRNHGSWFDREELRQILTFIRNGGLRKARDRELAKIDDEKQRLRAQQLASRSGLEGTALAGSLDTDPAGDPFIRLISTLVLH